MPKKLLVTAAVLILCTSAILSALSPLVAASDFYYDDNLTIFNYISINADGTVSGTDRIAANGNNYKLTGDISNKTIVIQRSGTTLDGNGHTFSGKSWQSGIYLADGLQGITIERLTIEGFDYGINCPYRQPNSTNSTNLNIQNNVFLNNTNAISLNSFITKVSIIDNSFIGGGAAISGSNNAVIRGNQFLGNTNCFEDTRGYGLVNDVDTSNTVNGKPLYYWVNQHDKTVPSDAGWVCLKNCSKITVQGLTLNQSSDGITLLGTKDSTIKNNLLVNNYYGIAVYDCNKTLISNNQVIGSKDNGIFLAGSTANTVAKNEVTNCSVGIFVLVSDGYINQNQINENSKAGLRLGVGYLHDNITYSAFVSQNTISRNNIGVWVDEGTSYTLVLNNITDNVEWGIKLEGTQRNNTIIQNNFVSSAGNMPVYISGYWKQTSAGGVINGIRHQPAYVFVAAAANVWDKSTDGNYWSDYKARYPNASEVANTGVGNTPYYINENNIDNHPHTQPFDITKTGSPVELNPSTVYIILAIVIVIVAIASISLVYFKRRRGKP
jgi:parallel beta-helix repeat protein